MFHHRLSLSLKKNCFKEVHEAELQQMKFVNEVRQQDSEHYPQRSIRQLLPGITVTNCSNSIVHVNINLEVKLN